MLVRRPAVVLATLAAFATGAACAGARPRPAPVAPPPVDAAGAPTRQVAGRIVGAGGAAVDVLLLSFSWTFERPKIVARARAAADGRFDLGRHRVEPSPAGRFELLAVAPGLAPAEVPIDLDRESATDDMVVALGPCDARIRGTVANPKGAPLRGVEVRFELFDVVMATTDARGRYEVCTPREVTALELRAPGYGARTDSVYAPGTVVHDAVLDREAILAGRVVDPEGHGVARVAVWVAPDRTEPHRPAVAVAETDAAGNFEIRGVGAGHLSVFAGFLDGAALYPAGLEEVTTTAGRAARGVVLRMGSSRRVEGIVRAGDAPAAHAALTWHPARGASRQVRTDASGRFSILLPPGPLDVDVEGFEVRALRLDSELGPATAEVEVVRTRPLVRGRVVHDGVPVPGVPVVRLGSSDRVLSGPDGSFELTLSEVGAFRLNAMAPAVRALGVAADCAVVGDATFDGVIIDLVHGGAVAGVVVDAAGAPVVGARVRLVNASHDDFGTAVTGADGSFLATRLKGGRDEPYSVAVYRSLESEDELPAAAGPFTPITVADGRSTVDGIRLVVAR